MKALTPLSPLLSEPTPHRMVIRFAFVMSLLLIVTQVAAVLHVKVTNTPVLILLAALPALGLFVTETIMEQTVARRATYLAFLQKSAELSSEQRVLEHEIAIRRTELTSLVRGRVEAERAEAERVEKVKRLEKERRILIRTFSVQEQAILDAIVSKQDDKVIATTLHITLDDIASARLKFLRKLKVNSVDELINVVKRNR